MTFSKHVTLWCDYGEPYPNSECMQWTGGDMHRVAEARRQAVREGWKSKDGKDYCPQHAKGTSKHA